MQKLQKIKYFGKEVEKNKPFIKLMIKVQTAKSQTS